MKFAIAGAFLPAMKEKDAGHIINITSDSERVPFPGVAVYTGKKTFENKFYKLDILIVLLDINDDENWSKI